MDPQVAFDIAAVARIALPCIVAGIASLLPRPRSMTLKLPSAILAGWVAAVAFTLYVYNPAGVTAGHAAGVDSPEMRFDNNTVAVAILGGWVYPALAVAAVLVVRTLLRNRRASL
jgi:hypothetical protein